MDLYLEDFKKPVETTKEDLEFFASEVLPTKENMSVSYFVEGIVSPSQEDDLIDLVQSRKLSGYELDRDLEKNQTKVSLHGVSIEFTVNLY